MANHNNDNTAYDLNRFSAAPKRKPAPAARPAKPRLVKPVKKTKAQLKLEKRANLITVFKFSVVAIICFAFIGSNINYRVQINELNGSIVRLNKELNEKKSENTRLNMELNSKISLANVKDYAENTLGMVKRERYQIVYFNLDDNNEIIPAQ